MHPPKRVTGNNFILHKALNKGLPTWHRIRCMGWNKLNKFRTTLSGNVKSTHFTTRAQWFRGRASDSRLRDPGFESCAAVLKPWARFFTLHCSSSPSCINEYLAIDSDGYVYEQHSRINCKHMAGCFPEKLRWCLSEQVCQGSKV